MGNTRCWPIRCFNDLSLGEDGVDVAGGKRGVPPDVIGSIVLHQRAARRHRLLHVHDGWERLVVDYDQLGCIVCEVSILSDHHRDRLAGVGDLVCRDGELLGHLLLVGDKGVADRQRPEDDAFEVGGGSTATTPFAARAPDVSISGSASVRVRAAHDRHVRHVHEVDVVDEVAVPGDELGILTTLDARPDHGGDSHGQSSTGAAADPTSSRAVSPAPPFIASDADRTAFLMFS